MNAILGWLSILESGKPIRDVHSVLDVIARNAQMQARLIDDLLDMNRLTSGNVQLDMGRVDVRALVQASENAPELLEELRLPVHLFERWDMVEDVTRSALEDRDHEVLASLRVCDTLDEWA